MSMLASIIPLVAALSLAALSDQGEGSNLGAAVGDERIDRIFAAYAKADSPGCAVAVVHRGNVLHQRGYGRAHLEWDAPITSSTVFHVASVSKPFTALAVALLAEEGKLSLDDDVRKYVPELPDYGRVVTLKHLLQHTSGLRDVWYLGGLAGWRTDDLVTDRDVLDLAARQKALEFDPGERFAYCNTGYTIAGIVVRRVTGQTLRAFTQARIFEPLGMKNTHFQEDHREVVRNRASAYSIRSGRPRIAVPTYEAVGSTGLMTTLEDLIRWDRNFYSRGVGGKSAIDQMLTPGRLNNSEANRYGVGLDYGLGLVVGRYRGLKTVSHSGTDRGYKAEFLQFPEQQFSVIILGNVDALEPYTMARQVAEIALAGQFPEAPEPRTPPDSRNPRDLPAGPQAHELAAWAGTYWNPRNGASWELSVIEGKLCLGRKALVPLAPNRFAIGGTSIELVFNAAGEGMPRRMTWLDVEPEEFEAIPRLRLRKDQFEEYAGEYRSDELNVVYKLSVSNGELTVRGWRDNYGPLRPMVADGFRLSPPALGAFVVRFTRDQSSKVTGFTLGTSGCTNIRFSRD
jgi:CubicO group peptidase (beta-lactamase class C family)